MIELISLDKKNRKYLIENARLIEYNEDYTCELCPNCFRDLKDQVEFLFTLGWRDKWEYLICKNCSQVIKRKP